MHVIINCGKESRLFYPILIGGFIMSLKKTFRMIDTGGTELLMKNLPFIFYIAFLGIIYIANSHYATKTVKQVNDTQVKMREMRWKIYSRKAELMYQSKLTEMATKVKDLGLKPLDEQAKKIEY